MPMTESEMQNFCEHLDLDVSLGIIAERAENARKAMYSTNISKTIIAKEFIALAELEISKIKKLYHL